MTRSVNEFLTWYYLNTTPSDESILTFAEELADDAVIEYAQFPKIDDSDLNDASGFAIPSDLPLTEIMHLR